VFTSGSKCSNKEAFLKEHLVDGQLLIEVDLEVAVRRELLGKARKRLETFAGQIADLSDHHDYKLVCKGEEFPCHQAILAARSPVVYITKKLYLYGWFPTTFPIRKSL